MKRNFSVIIGIYIFIIILFLLGLFSYSPIEAVFSSFLKRETIYAFLLSLQTAIIATVLGVIFAIPSAYYLARYEFRGKAVIESFIDIPIILPPLIIGVGLLILFGNKLSFLGIVFTKTAIIIAQFFIATPIMINALKGVFVKFPEEYEKIGMTLGLNRYEVLFRITLPILYPGIISSILLGFSRALGEFGATLMFAGATRFKTETMPIAIYLNIASGDFEIAISIAILYILIAIVIFVFLRKFLKRFGYEN